VDLIHISAKIKSYVVNVKNTTKMLNFIASSGDDGVAYIYSGLSGLPIRLNFMDFTIP
jgi:hypothetical protein